MIIEVQGSTKITISLNLLKPWVCLRLSWLVVIFADATCLCWISQVSHV